MLWLLLPYGAGAACARAAEVSGGGVLWLLGAVLLCGGAFCARHRGRLSAWLALAALFSAGAGRYVDARARLPEWDLLPPRALRVEMEITHVFSAKPDAKDQRLRGLARILSANDPGHELIGQQLAFTASGVKASHLVGDGAVVEALLVVSSLPYAPDGGTFEGYLAAQGVNFRANRGKVLRVLRPAPPWEQARLSLLRACEERLSRGLAHRPELIAIYHGMILGQVGMLQKDQTQLFSETGTLHLFSVSGLHIGVVALVLHTLLGAARLGLRPRVAVLLPLLAAYVYVTGSSPAAVRAFGMVAFLEIGRAAHRPVNPLTALGATALLALLWDPMQLFSVSFQYSYGIVAGLVLLGQPLADWLQDRFRPGTEVPAPLRRPWHAAAEWFSREGSAAVCLGLSATLIGEVCTLQYFRLLTPGGLFANLLLIPLSSLAIVAGMATLLLSALGLSVFAPLFNAAAGFVIQGLLIGLQPWHRVEATFTRASFSHPWIGMAALAGMLAVLLAGYHRRWQPWRWWLPAPFVMAALLLVFAVNFH